MKFSFFSLLSQQKFLPVPRFLVPNPKILYLKLSSTTSRLNPVSAPVKEQSFNPSLKLSLQNMTITGYRRGFK